MILCVLVKYTKNVRRSTKWGILDPTNRQLSMKVLMNDRLEFSIFFKKWAVKAFSARTHTHAHTHAHMHTHTHMHTITHTHTHTHTCTHTYTYMHTHTHTHTHMPHTYTWTHTHTHTHCMIKFLTACIVEIQDITDNVIIANYNCLWYSEITQVEWRGLCDIY